MSRWTPVRRWISRCESPSTRFIHPHHGRTVFYLAQTHRDLGHLDDAIRLYERRGGMGGWDQEVFYALLQVGVLRAEQGDWPDAMAGLVAAWEYRPQRLEPLYELASRLRLRGQHETAHLFAKRGLGLPQPDDILFVSPWVYRWGLWFEYSIAAYWSGETEEALAACDRLLAMGELPETYRQHTLANRRYCLERLSVTGPAAPSKTEPAHTPRDEALGRGSR